MYNIETDKFDSIDIGIENSEGYDDLVRVMYTIGIKCHIRGQTMTDNGMVLSDMSVLKSVRKIVEHEIQKYLNGKYEDKQNNM